MIDFGFDKIALIGAVALIVIGPEKLPKVARTDVKAEVNRSIELDELKKMKTDFEDAARNVEQTVQSQINEASTSFNETAQDWSSNTTSSADADPYAPLAPPPTAYKAPKKNWRVKRGAVPQWYRQRHGIRAKAQSGAARVARFRPPGLKSAR